MNHSAVGNCLLNYRQTVGDTFCIFSSTNPTLVNVNFCNSICMLGVSMKFMVMINFFSVSVSD